MPLGRFALLITGLTFLLLLLGGLVHNTHSSLACPDWPLCFGQVFPKMEGGVLVEHSHRLVAGAIALSTAFLVFASWRRAQKSGASGDRILARIATLALALVLVQALLGGITVLLRLPAIISTLHLAFSQLFFLSLIFYVFRAEPHGEAALAPKVQRMTLVATVLVFLQMLVGAFMRHLGAGLGCLDIPLCRGQLWPTDVHPNVTLHVVHRLFGLLVFGHLIGMAIVVAKSAAAPLVKRLALLAPLLAALQIGLGVWSVLSLLDPVPVTAHLGAAAALLADCAIVYLFARGPVVAAAPLPLGARAAA